MALHNTIDRWGWLAKALHWIVAILIIGLGLVGYFMVNMTGWYYPDMVDATRARVDLTQTHKSFGFVVFCLAVIRLLWRWTSKLTPALPETTKGWQSAAVHTVHYGLYVLMIMLPLSGWLMSSASPLNDVDAYPMQIKNMVFGLFELPDPYLTSDRAMYAIYNGIHIYAGYALAAFLFLHVAGVLYHHFILRDSVLTRMLPFGKDRT